jgi:hypothetical protein
VRYFFIGNQKVVLFLKYKKNSWKPTVRTLKESQPLDEMSHLASNQMLWFCV